MCTPAIPSNLRQSLPYPNTPWRFSSSVLARMSQGNNPKLRKCELLPTDLESQFIVRCFHLSKPHNYAIAKIFCIHNPIHVQTFESRLIKMHETKKPYLPGKILESGNEQKQENIKRWKEQVEIFQPLEITIEGQTLFLTSVQILPLWYGNVSEYAEEGSEAMDGNRISFINSASLYAKGPLFLAWVAMREPCPFSNETFSPSSTNAKQHFPEEDYNAYFKTTSSTQDKMLSWDEVVVFHKSQVLTSFLIDLAIDAPLL